MAADTRADVNWRVPLNLGGVGGRTLFERTMATQSKVQPRETPRFRGQERCSVAAGRDGVTCHGINVADAGSEF